MILVNKDYLPLLPRIDIVTHYLVDGVLEEILASHLYLLEVIAVGLLLLPYFAKDAEQLGSDVERVDPWDIAY